MDFLGVGPLELLFIILIALIILGPKDMVKTGRTLGRFMRQVITSPTWHTVQKTSRSLRKLPTQLMRDAGIEEIQAELKNEMEDVNRTGKALGAGLRQDIEQARQELDFSAWTSAPPPSILPPQAELEDAQPTAAEQDDSSETVRNEAAQDTQVMRKFFRALWRVISAPFRLIRNVRNKIRHFFRDEIEESTVADAFAKTVENPAGLLDHLDALRKNLLYAVLGLVIATAATFGFSRAILRFLAVPVGGLDKLVAIDVTEPIGAVMRVVLLSGFTLAFPFIAFELWLFIAPGLAPRSRGKSFWAIPIATLFFIGGMAFAYYIMLPTALPFLLSFMDFATVPRPSSYFSFVTGLMFWIGVAFEFPLVIFLLASLGLVKAKLLQEQWRLAVVIIAIISALITPTIDPINMFLVMGPMILLYLLSIILAKLAQPKQTS